MLMVELNVPRYVHTHIARVLKRTYGDVVKEVSRSRGTGITRVFIRDCPKGWWIALKILRKGIGKLYVLNEIKYMEIPSKVMELSMKQRWKSEYDKIIGEELRKWGLRQ